MGLRTNNVLLKKGGNVTENRYNLLDEAWIPIADMGKAGLLRVSGGRECRALGGTAVQKIAVLKLLIAIAQAAATPQDTQEWAVMGPNGLGKQCVAYLERWRDAFWLYGDKPFLQMPTCAKAELKPYGTALAQVASAQHHTAHAPATGTDHVRRLPRVVAGGTDGVWPRRRKEGISEAFRKQSSK